MGCLWLWWDGVGRLVAGKWDGGRASQPFVKVGGSRRHGTSRAEGDRELMSIDWVGSAVEDAVQQRLVVGPEWDSRGLCD